MSSTNALDEIVTRPWHLKLDVTLFDENGKNPQQGAIEVWQAGDNRRTEYNFGSSKQIELTVDGKGFFSTSGEVPSDTAIEVLDGILHPGPKPIDLEGASPEIRTQVFGKQTFDCVMLTHPVRDLKKVPIGLFPTFCAIQGSSDLRISYPSGVDILLRQHIGTFLDHHVTTELSVAHGGIERAHAKVASLSSMPETADEFKRVGGLSPIQPKLARVAGGVIAGAKIGGENPRYPPAARIDHISGTVVLRALIGVDGHIHSLRVQSAPDPDLAIASLAAVRTWRYKPYLLNGLPTSVDTTITVNFNLNPF